MTRRRSLLAGADNITREELAVWYAGMLAVSMGLGTFFSGALVDWLAKRSKVWYALLPAIAMTCAIPFWVAYVWAPTWEMSIAILAVPTFFTIVYLAPALALERVAAAVGVADGLPAEADGGGHVADRQVHLAQARGGAARLAPVARGHRRRQRRAQRGNRVAETALGEERLEALRRVVHVGHEDFLQCR